MQKPDQKQSFSLRKTFNATLFALGLGCGSLGGYNVVDGVTSASMQDFSAATACDARMTGQEACTAPQVKSLLNIRDSFQRDAMGFTYLLGAGLLFMTASEQEEKRKKSAKQATPGK